MAAIERLGCAEHEECQAAAEQIIAQLTQADDEGWAHAVDAALFALHLDVLERKCWPQGWQPADLARTATRELGAAARRCVTDLMVAQLRAYPASSIDEVWHDQLADLDAKVWWAADADYVRELGAEHGLGRAEAIDTLVRLLNLLAQLPRLEVLTALPGQARAAAAGRRVPGARSAPGEEKLLARVRALLAKAESTTFEAEADTFTAAAQAMMARHNIDEALLHRHDGQDDDRPSGIRLAVDNPYPEPKAILLQQIAEANRCRAVWSRHLGFTTVLGYRADTAWVELLYTSLLVQATTAMTKAGSKTTRHGTSRTRAFRSAFLESFAVRIGERLRQATQEAETEAAEAGARDLLPVLADRSKAVDEELFRVFPQMTNTRRESWNIDNEGWSAGRTAADLTDLAHSKAVDSGAANR